VSRSIFRLHHNITKAATQLYAPSGSVKAFAVLLLDQVKEDCTDNHKFERNWLEAKHKAQAEAV
jgi:hypothetical protein